MGSKGAGAAHKNQKRRGVYGGDAQRFLDDRLPVWGFHTSTTRPRMTKISRFARNDDTKG